METKSKEYREQLEELFRQVCPDVELSDAIGLFLTEVAEALAAKDLVLDATQGVLDAFEFTEK